MHTFSKPLRLLVFFTLALALGLGACNFSLAGDVTPPPGWHPTPVPPTPNIADLYPALPPDPAAGQALYQQHCQKCHGPKGLGNGSQAAALGITPAALADPAEARQAIPAQRFAVLTQGKMASGMPPFAQVLTERQRWDVLAYVYTLSIAPETLQRGKTLYAARCATCHGPDGSGKNLTAQKRMAQTSDTALAAAITGRQHPQKVYAGLGETDRLALAAYIRTLSFVQPEAAGPSPTATPAPAGTPAAANTAEAAASTTPTAAPTPAANTLTITGQVTNGTAGGSVPAGLQVTLHGYDKDTLKEVFRASASLDGQNKFVFHNVPAGQQRFFFVTAEHAKVLYGSHTATALPGNTSLDLPVTIYETTTDPGQVRIERLHVFVMPQTDQAIQVIEMYIITNDGDRTLVSPEAGQPVLTFNLPPGAAHLQFQEGSLGGRYVTTDHGFGDVLPIYPQRTTQEVFAYTLPFTGKPQEIAHPVPLPVSATVLMAPEGQLVISGSGLADGGVQQDQSGNTFRVYNLTTPLQAGDTLRFTVKKEGRALPLGSGKTGLAIGLLALGAALIAIAIVLTRRERPPAPADVPADIADDPDALLDAVLALDDLYEEGKIDETAYRRRRGALKARLKTLLAADGTEDEPEA